MAKVQIVTDSTAYFSKEYAEQNNIRIVPLSVTFSGETVNEGFPGEFEAFYRKLQTSKDFPTTSQPSIEAFVSVYEEILAQGRDIVTIVISEKLSGTYNSASAAANMTAPDRISVIDSETTVSNLKLLVKIANDMAEQGSSREEIVTAIEQEKKRMQVILAAGTLEYLKRGGRLSAAQAAIGTLLNVKPIIGLVDGKLEAVAKVRGNNKALDYLVENVPDNAVAITVLHILSTEGAEIVHQKLQERFPDIQIGIDEIGPVIGSHLGPGGVGVCSKW
ncbi:MAG: DegV family protein [Caldicoprobacterales bacterium]|jgi:DegV family protein with EDD domain|nr:DegV family protein [Clostridiales bacterium]